MASEKLEIIITVADKTKGALGGVHANIQKIGKVALGIGAAGLGALAGGLAMVAKNAILAGSDAEEMLSKFNIVFAETGGQVTDQLLDFSEAVGASRFELMGMASTFGDTLKPMGFTEEAAAAASVTMSKLAVDLASFNNISTDEALRRLQGTLIGSHENALAFGVVITAATLKEELMRMGAEDLTGAMFEQAKVQARMNLLMAGTTDAQGDALRTAGGFANQMKALKSTFADVSAEIGLKLLPIVTPLLARFGEMAKDILPAVVEGVGFVVAGIADFFGNVEAGMSPLNAFMGAMQGIIPPEMLDNIFNMVIAFETFFEKVQEFAAPIIAFVLQWVSMKDVLLALGIAIAAFVIPALISIAVSMAPILLAGALLIGAISLLRNAWENDWGGMQTKLTAFWEETAKPAFEQLQLWLGETIPIVLQTLSTFWTETLMPAMIIVWAWMQDVLFPFFQNVLIPIIRDGIMFYIQAMAVLWLDILLPAVQRIWKFLSSDMMPVWEALGELMGVAVPLAMQVLGFWFDETKKSAMVLWQFIQKNLGPVMESLKSNIIDPLTSSFGGLKEMIASIVGTIGNMTAALSSVELPDWMTPGSPTPWEIGLKGVNNAMSQLASVSLPALTSQLTSTDAAVVTNTTNNNMTWNVQTSSINTDGETRAGLAFAGGI